MPNQSQVRNIDFEIQPKEGNNTLCFLLFLQPFNSSHLWNYICPISMWFSAKCSLANTVYNEVKMVETEFAWLKGAHSDF